jgi:SAM-dependent methyltransferase
MNAPDQPSTESIYDAQASKWARSERILLSDFTARPRVIEALAPLGGVHVLDLGCGEGYVSRLAMQAGAASVFGVDLSSEMVKNAQAAVPAGDQDRMQFVAANAATLDDFPRQSYERVMAVFLFNYITRREMVDVLSRARNLLAPGGRFVFTVPHPCFPYMRAPGPPFFFETEGRNYFAGADETYEGRIWRRDGKDVAVRCVHKTLADYFDALAQAGWSSLPKVSELSVRQEHIELDPDFFGPLEGQPLHLLFALEANA